MLENFVLFKLSTKESLNNQTYRTAIALDSASVEAVKFDVFHKITPIRAEVLATIGTYQTSRVGVDSRMSHVRAPGNNLKIKEKTN